jgi:hypothetical protein
VNYWPPGSPTDLAERRRWHVARGPFLSPSEAPPKCKPTDGDPKIVSYRCVNPDCKGNTLAHTLNRQLGSEDNAGVQWGVPADPRAHGYDRDWQPEDAWCPFCGEEGEPLAVEDPAELLRRVAPELGT